MPCFVVASSLAVADVDFLVGSERTSVVPLPVKRLSEPLVISLTACRLE